MYNVIINCIESNYRYYFSHFNCHSTCIRKIQLYYYVRVLWRSAVFERQIPIWELDEMVRRHVISYITLLSRSTDARPITDAAASFTASDQCGIESEVLYVSGEKNKKWRILDKLWWIQYITIRFDIIKH